MSLKAWLPVATFHLPNGVTYEPERFRILNSLNTRVAVNWVFLCTLCYENRRFLKCWQALQVSFFVLGVLRGGRFIPEKLCFSQSRALSCPCKLFRVFLAPAYFMQKKKNRLRNAAVKRPTLFLPMQVLRHCASRLRLLSSVHFCGQDALPQPFF